MSSELHLRCLYFILHHFHSTLLHLLPLCLVPVEFHATFPFHLFPVHAILTPFRTAHLVPIQVSPSAVLYTNRGVIHQFMGDVVSAMDDYQRATKLDPHYPLAHFNTGNVLFQQKLFKQVSTRCHRPSLQLMKLCR